MPSPYDGSVWLKQTPVTLSSEMSRYGGVDGVSCFYIGGIRKQDISFGAVRCWLNRHTLTALFISCWCWTAGEETSIMRWEEAHVGDMKTTTLRVWISTTQLKLHNTDTFLHSLCLAIIYFAVPKYTVLFQVSEWGWYSTQAECAQVCRQHDLNMIWLCLLPFLRCNWFVLVLMHRIKNWLV